MRRTFASLSIPLLVACASTPPTPRVFFSVEDGLQEHAARLVEADGSLVREISDLPHVYAARVTPAGTVLATLCEDDGRPLGVAEIARDGSTLWRYDWPAGRDGIEYLRASHALENGNVLLAGLCARGDDGRFASAIIFEMERTGATVRSVKLGPTQYLGAVRPIADGVLVAGEGVFELNWNGVARAIVPHSTETLIYDALPLPNGHCVLGETAQRIVEIDPQGGEVWSVWHVKPVFLQSLAGGHFLAGG
jgi:hypothetical protein